MSGDSMVYDMSQMSEGSPQVFVKRDWLNLQDQNNGNYRGSQMILDTSQLANSNKYMAYREAYLAVPILLTATNGSTGLMANPSSATTSADRLFGLKNWFGSLIHSITLDYAGTTIIQQTPLCSMWNQFSLMTTLSLQDVLLNGPTIGFYPDTSDSFAYVNGDSASGPGTRNTFNATAQAPLVGEFAVSAISNVGYAERQKVLMYDPDATPQGSSAYNALLTQTSMNEIYRGGIFNKTASSIQTQAMAIIRLKDIHPFFSQVPLLKGVFMRLTLNLNQTSVTITEQAGNIQLTNVDCPLGGVNPLMISATGGLATSLEVALGGAINAIPGGLSAPTGAPIASPIPTGGSLTYSIAVGNKCLNAAQVALGAGSVVKEGTLAQSVFLYVPAYTFNPVYEEAYLANSTKTIVYSDIYQFQTAEAGPGGQYNFLITNGIANIRSVLVLPFFSTITTAAGTGVGSVTPPYQSPFDPAGCGPTSPLTAQTNFNVVIAGQNMIYNTQKYSFEQYMNQLQGCNSVNANLVNGLTSSLVSQWDFDNSYQYYYVNTSRMLPVDEAVPKSCQIQGTNRSVNAVKFIVFVEYGVQVSVDVLTGSRV